MTVSVESAHQIDWRLETIPGLGAKTLAKLHDANIFNIWQLLCHKPIRYEDYTTLLPPAHWQDHLDAAPVLLQGLVTKTWSFFSKGRKMTYCQMMNDGVSIRIGFFFLPPQIKKQLEQGQISLRCYGKVVLAGNVLSMYHPKYWLIDGDGAIELEKTLTPVYRAITGIAANRLRKIMLLALQRLDTLQELYLNRQATTLSISQAMHTVHQPTLDDFANDKKALLTAYWRLAEEEAIVWCSALQSHNSNEDVYPVSIKASSYAERLIKQLPFTLTADQQTVLTDIETDLQGDQAMRRLLQGDVGCGKTIVAMIAAVSMIEAGYQVALLAPTTILAQQHYQLAQQLLAGFDICSILLIANQDSTEQNRQLAQSGEAQLIIGTHALFSEKTLYQKLGLVIIDEQHRFGVNQKQALYKKGIYDNTHALMMSATPIPRSLAQAMFQVNACSKIQSMPAGRKPIITSLLSVEKRQSLFAKVIEKAKQGHQIYWVCPRIDVEQKASVLELFAQLKEQAPDVTIGLLHGRLSAAEKANVLHQFAQGALHILVCTVVVEVGVNVPNANFMIIDEAQQYGLAQLHQLRGRVGRSDQQGYCMLNYGADITDEGVERLKLMKSCQDGFELAQQDLTMRGPGELLGLQQSGCPPWRFLSWPVHKDLLTHTQHYMDDKLLNVDKKYLVELLWNQSSTLK